MASRTLLAIDVGHRVLIAVEALAQRGRVQVVRRLEAELPPGAEDASPAERGAMVRQALRAAGITSTRATWVLPRERVVAKRLDLPAAESHELPGMVRLAMQHETSMGPDSVVDYWQQPGAAAGAPSDLWAVGAPAAELAAVHAMAAAAGIGVDRVAPRTCGTAALLAPLAAAAGADAADATVAFDLAAENAEIVAADRQGLRTTRGTVLASAEPDLAVTEARRSWTALRLTQPDLKVARALVMGGADTAQALAAALDRDVQVELLTAHPEVDTGGTALGRAWPLAGLLLEEIRRTDRLDLAHPHRAPDVAARRRMRAYAAVSIVLLAYCVGWAVGRKDRTALEDQRTEIASKARRAQTEFDRYKRDELKARHLEAWRDAQPQWLDTMLYLHGFAPDPARVVLESWSGQVDEVEVGYSKDGFFRLPPGVRVAMDVETMDRATADALREALIERREWTVKSNSSEGKPGHRLPVAVQLQLTSAGAGAAAAATPPASGAASPASAAAPATGGQP